MPERQQAIPGIIGIAYALLLGFVGGDTNDVMILSSVLLAAAGCYKLLPALGGKPFQWSPVFTVMCAYLAWLVVLVYTSSLTENSLYFAWLFSGFVLVTYLTADMDRQNWFFTFVLVAITGLVSAFWGISQFVVTASRASGPIIDPSTWGSINNLFFFASLYVVMVVRERRALVLALTALAIFAVAVFCAYSRVGTFIFFSSLGFIVVICARQRALRTRLALVVAIAVLSYGAVHTHATLAQAAGHNEGYTLDVHQKGWSQRFAMWRAGWEIYKAHPLFGSGTGTFKVQYPMYRNHGDMQTLGNFVHNDYLQLLAEGGPVLLLFLLAFVAVLLVRLVRKVPGLSRGNPDGIEPVLLTVAMGTLLIHSLMSFPLYMPQNQLLVGLLFGRYLHVEGLLHTRQIRPASPRLVQGGAIFGVVMLALLPMLDVVSNELVFERHRIPLVDRLAENPSAYLETMLFLSIVRSTNSSNRFEMATMYRSAFDSRREPAARRALAITTALEYQAGLALNPYNEKVRKYFAEFLMQNPWLEQEEEIHWTPESLYREGVRIFPVDVSSYLALSKFLASTGREDEAYRLLVDKALPWADLDYRDTYDIRRELFQQILEWARAREDTATLKRLLAAM